MSSSNKCVPDINFPSMPLSNNHGLHSPDHLVMEDGTSGPSHPRGSRHPTIVDKVGRDGHLINVAIRGHGQVDSGRIPSHILPIKLAVTLNGRKQVKRGFTNYQPKKLLKNKLNEVLQTTCHEVLNFLKKKNL